MFCLPFIIGFLVFLIIPMGISFYYSLCDYDILSPPEFVGLKNYIDMFTNDEVFWHSIKATLYFALVSVPLRFSGCSYFMEENVRTRRCCEQHSRNIRD